MSDKCSLSLNTRVRDTRNLMANFAHYLDLNNTQFTNEDNKKKCEIFGIQHDKIDFITFKVLKGIGDHYYPLSGERKKHNRIGSDSMWNRIPVTGYNSKYKKQEEYLEKLNQWEEYCKSRGAKMFYNLTEEQNDIIKKGVEELERINQKMFDDLKSTISYVEVE